MQSVEKIAQAVSALKDVFSLRRVDLFGSYADGCATEESDVDLLVVFDRSAVSLLKINALRYALEETLGLDVDVIHAPLPEDSMIRPGKLVRVL